MVGIRVAVASSKHFGILKLLKNNNYLLFIIYNIIILSRLVIVNPFNVNPFELYIEILNNIAQ